MGTVGPAHDELMEASEAWLKTRVVKKELKFLVRPMEMDSVKIAGISMRARAVTWSAMFALTPSTAMAKWLHTLPTSRVRGLDSSAVCGIP